ncbi:MAG TPA: NAD(P)-dependent oxidoreductase [Pseudonocardiaceae bacterium]|jgi:nucleoside-diphosphate-sugar epimerase
MVDHRVLITGAAGGVGTLMRPRLARAGRALRLLDLLTVEPPADGEQVEIITGSVTDPETMRAACRDVDAVLHLGGLSREASWEEILEVNIDGTHTVLEAARAEGVSRVILASSNHAVGFRTNDEAGTDGVSADTTARPDTYYGFSKAALEALGSLYHDRFGMDVICVRIGSCFPTPPGVRGLTTWLSPDDGGRLFEACLTAPKPGYRVIWGVSNNTRRVYSLREAEELGYVSKDNAEVFAEELIAAQGQANPSGADYLGGPFTTTELGRPNPM